EPIVPPVEGVVQPDASCGEPLACDTAVKVNEPGPCLKDNEPGPLGVSCDEAAQRDSHVVDVEPVASSGLAPQCETGSKDDAPDACNGVDAQIPVFVGDDLSGAFQVGNGAFPINVDDGPEPVTVDDEPLPLAAVDCEGRPIEICSQDSLDVTIVREVRATSSTRVSFLRPRVNNSPEVKITGETSCSKFDGSSYKTPETVLSKSRFNATLNSMSSMADGLYDEEGNLSNYEKCKRLNFDLGSTSQGKMVRCRRRRINRPNSFYRDFVTNECNVRFSFNKYERLYYENVLFYADDPRYSGTFIIDYGGVRVKFAEFANSMRRDAQSSVSKYDINAHCRKLFKDCHPSNCYKHYFFSTVGDYLMRSYPVAKHEQYYESAKRSFKLAHDVLDLRRASLLLFSIFYEGHWFGFVVDIRDGYFVFLDSFFEEDSDYHKTVRNILIPNFLEAWDEFIMEPFIFDKFSYHYENNLPKQERGEFFRAQHDGIFLMKYLELWDPCDNMLVKFTSRNILDIRLLYVVDMVLSKHNQLTDVNSLVEDYNTVLELKREQGMVQAQQEQQQRAQQEKQRAQ
ncbi:hypothetical protein EJB05_20191, partial [Eragrostis curvula]